MKRNDPSRLRSNAIAILGTGAVAIAAAAVVLVLMSGSRDRTGQTASRGSTPTEQVKAPPGGTGSNETTAQRLKNRKADEGWTHL
jgi:hypothetical protein